MSYNIIIQSDKETVVSEYTPVQDNSVTYQSEYELEQDFIAKLKEQGYQYLTISTEPDLISNLRRQLENLNSIIFSESEWEQFFKSIVANTTDGIVEKTRRIQEDHVQVLKRDDGTSENITLINKANIHENNLQVINQYEQISGNHPTRYDVTILVNGLPLVHIELKRRGVALKEAFNQIKRYQRDSFWAGSGLFEYVQLFVISNGTETKYYSNTTRDSHIKELNESGRRKGKNTSNSFEFTSYWADANNNRISDLVDFTRTFFAKHTLLPILTRYCVFTVDNLLLVMRPYQIAATERILNRIVCSTNYKDKLGSLEAGGYIWHTTGSGKTLTSFKAAQLACNLQTDYPIDKVMFIVDRKDLDYQTMREYDKFEKGSANSNSSTKILKKQLENPEVKIIITTIQKLSRLVSNNAKHDIYKKHVVIIFDECHRSQFGDMRSNIVNSFKKYHIFGFTGTPIFPQNASNSGNITLKTTEQAFGDKLHSYTVVNAIDDQNVLPFKVDFINTLKPKDEIDDAKIKNIDVQRALSSPERVKQIIEYILANFDKKTKRKQNFYNIHLKRPSGFNSLFAVSSIDMAKKYYTELKRQIEETNSNLKVGIIYSFSANEDDPDEGVFDETLEPDNLDKSSRDFLDAAIDDYNILFTTNFDTSAEKFQNYYKDVSDRVKKRELDILVVVNMFLTGFDATTLNTLWVDKDLRLHGLMQAFSRTNRILNSVKKFGNIICFRDLKPAMDEALALFGDKDAGGIILLKSYDEYYYGYDDADGNHVKGYVELINELKENYSQKETILGEAAEKEFIRLYNSILRLKNILDSFDEFETNKILDDKDFQDFHSIYLDFFQKYRKQRNSEREDINDDLVFEIELVRQVEVNIDYILLLVSMYHKGNFSDKELLVKIQKAINSSLQLRSKKKLIEQFVQKLNSDEDVDSQWKKFVQTNRDKDILDIINSENLKKDETIQFMENALRDETLKTTGTEIDNILPPIPRFSSNVDRVSIKERVITKLKDFFETFFGLSS
ncbi:MAG: type I restriction endonuclease subunit R [Deltaproteobacteria bacterium]|jgi:type I restriction enzyme R subunit|nr:type I restriction endonuclease subunit R [Deltaproteobacteria bacterium]